MLLYLALVSIDLATGFYARFISGGNAEDSARTAAWVFDVNDKGTSQIVDLSAVNAPGVSEDYKFIITNKRGSTVGEVDTQYTIKFEALGSLPLTYSLNGSKLFETAVAGNTGEQTGTFEASVSTDTEYTLTVHWPKESNDPIYASGSGVASLRVTILGEQVD